MWIKTQIGNLLNSDHAGNIYEENRNSKRHPSFYICVAIQGERHVIMQSEEKFVRDYVIQWIENSIDQEHNFCNVQNAILSAQQSKKEKKALTKKSE